GARRGARLRLLAVADQVADLADPAILIAVLFPSSLARLERGTLVVERDFPLVLLELILGNRAVAMLLHLLVGKRHWFLLVGMVGYPPHESGGYPRVC